MDYKLSCGIIHSEKCPAHLFLLRWQSSELSDSAPSEPSSEELLLLESDELLEGRPESCVRSTLSATAATSGQCSWRVGGVKSTI